MNQGGPSRTVKQEQKEISHNQVPTIVSLVVISKRVWGHEWIDKRPLLMLLSLRTTIRWLSAFTHSMVYKGQLYKGRLQGYSAFLGFLVLYLTVSLINHIRCMHVRTSVLAVVLVQLYLLYDEDFLKFLHRKQWVSRLKFSITVSQCC